MLVQTPINLAIRDWNDLNDSLISSAEVHVAVDCLSRFTSLVRY